MRMRTNGRFCFGLNGQPKSRRETHRAQHAKPVLAQPRVWIVDGAQDFILNVGAAIHMINDVARSGIHKKSIDGEIAPICISNFIANFNVLGTAAIHITAVGAKTGDLHHAPLVMHQDHAKTFTNPACLGKYGSNLLGGGAGGDIKIGW